MVARDRRRVLTLLFSLALSCAAAAQTVRGGAGVSAGVPLVPVSGALGELKPSAPSPQFAAGVAPLSGALLAPAPDLQSALPALELPSSAVEEDVYSVPVEAVKNPIFHRLGEALPFEEPRASDWQGARAYAEEAFDFKTGAEPASFRGKGEPPAKSPGAPSADDGGGPNYPHATVTFHKQEFRSVLLRPNVPVEPELIRIIDTAKKSVHIALAEFKQKAVLRALRAARNRGVEVHVVLDFAAVFPQADPEAFANTVRSPEIWSLLRNDFDVKVVRGLGRAGVMNANIAVADFNEKGDQPQIAAFGSYEWTFTAETNYYDSVNLSTTKDTVDAVMKTWKWLESLGKPASYGSKVSDYSWPDHVDPSPFEIKPTIALGDTLLLPAVVSPNRVPGQSFENWIVAAIGASKKKIEIAAPFIRSRLIADALAQAKARGLAVRVLVDRKRSGWQPFAPFTQWLAAQGVEVRTLLGPNADSPYPGAQTMHQKFAVFDDEVVETGSPDFTKRSAIANFELAHFLKNADAYRFAFEHMWKRAQPYPAPAQAPVLPTDAELIAEVDLPAPPPVRPEPHPGPAPGVAARQFQFNGDTFDSYMFRPDKPILPYIVKAIKGATKSLRVSIYELTQPAVVDALRWVRDNKPEVKIEIVIDRSHVYTSGKDRDENPNMPSDEIVALIEEEFDVLVLKGEASGIQHNKFIIVDAEKGGMVFFGSYNLSKHAEDAHYENLIFSPDKERVQDYLRYFNYQRALAVPVDLDKFEEVRNRTASQAQTEQLQALSLEPQAWRAGQAVAPKKTKYPDPPASRSTPVTVNGESYFKTYFSPHGEIEDAILRAINSAVSSLELGVFSFYSRPIADALRDAVKRGVEVFAVLDADQAKLTKRYDNFGGQTVDEFLAAGGVHVRLLAGPDKDGDPQTQKMHDKFLVADRKLLLTGSFNFSDNAQHNNFENENVLTDAADIAGYVDMFQRMFLRGWRPKSQQGNPGTPAPPKNLAAEFKESLLRYHRADGRRDGSVLDGVQYPPIKEVVPGDEKSLKAFIKELSGFLAKQPSIEHKPAPQDPQQRQIFRSKLAQESAAEIRAHALAEFTKLVDGLKNEKVKTFVKTALAQAQPEFWRAPSSSSGKYHPADEINYAGLLLHTIRNVIVSRMLGEFLGLAPERQDIVDAAQILHDVQKGGIPWQHSSKPGDAPDSGYVHDHGPVAGHWLRDFVKDCGADCEAIIEQVSTHMAQWNKPRPTPPKNLEEQIVSYGDYLASQDNVYVKWRTTAEPPPKDLAAASPSPSAVKP